MGGVGRPWRHQNVDISFDLSQKMDSSGGVNAPIFLKIHPLELRLSIEETLIPKGMSGNIHHSMPWAIHPSKKKTKIIADVLFVDGSQES